MAFISNSGETTNVDELDEMIEIFNLENTKIDLWIGTSSHILNKAKLVFKVKTDTKDIGNLEVFFAFSDFNKPIENVIPDAEALDIYKIYYLLFGVDILGTDL